MKLMRKTFRVDELVSIEASDRPRAAAVCIDDTVWLRSGSPELRVVGIDGERAWVKWGENERGDFAKAALTKVPTPLSLPAAA